MHDIIVYKRDGVVPKYSDRFGYAISTHSHGQDGKPRRDGLVCHLDHTYSQEREETARLGDQEWPRIDGRQ